MGLDHAVRDERLSSGVSLLDALLGGRGYYRGSTILVSGTAGTGKTTIAGYFADAACRRGEQCLWFLFEESPQQVVRNMRSVGLDLRPWLEAERLEMCADRPSRWGLEAHLTVMHRAVERVAPDVVIVDPVTNLLTVGTEHDVRDMLTRFIDFLKTKGITALFTSLSPGKTELQETATGISSLMDTWVLLALSERDGSRSRSISVIKSRGMAHSDEIREFVLTDRGLEAAHPVAGAASSTLDT
jgi:circadian clock protein KaiC